MPYINQIPVIHQRAASISQASHLNAPDQHETCGFHTLKNSLLTLLKEQQIITNQRFENLALDPAFFSTILQATQDINAAQRGGRDLSLGHFMTLLERVKSGELDLTAYGINTTDLQKLNITQDGRQDLSVVKYYLNQYAPEHGLNGMESDLLNAAALVKFAKSTGPISHTFALAINDKHWITAILNKDNSGDLEWNFMDSEGQNNIWNGLVVAKIEHILNKSELQLKNYLIEAYDAPFPTQTINRRYATFFNQETGIVNQDAKFDPEDDGNELNAHQFFLEHNKNRNDYLNQINNRFTFMKTSDWLTDAGPEELQRMKQLNNIAKFMLDNANPTAAYYNELIQELDPITTELSESITHLELGVQISAEPTVPVNNNVAMEITTAINDIENQTPSGGPTFAQSFVNAIKFVMEGISNAFNYVMQAVGIKA